MQGADTNRRALVRHALRSLVKAGDREALAILGYGHAAGLTVGGIEIVPRVVRLGERARVSVDVRNPKSTAASALIDLRVHFVKADGGRRPKVFKLGVLTVPPRSATTLRKTISFAEMTTRTHYAGRHKVDVLVNGRIKPGLEFDVLPRPRRTRRV
jgi:hypothetical protein